MDGSRVWYPNRLSTDQKGGDQNDLNLDQSMIDGEFCHICSKPFFSQSSLEQHLKTHGDEKNYPCTLCSFRADSSTNLRNHMLAHALIKSHPCPYCSFETSFKSNLNRHVKRKHQDKNIDMITKGND